MSRPEQVCWCGSTRLYPAVNIEKFQDRTPLRCSDCQSYVDPDVFYRALPFDDLFTAYCDVCRINCFARIGPIVVDGESTTKCYYCRCITMSYAGGYRRVCYGCSESAGYQEGLCPRCDNLPAGRWVNPTGINASSYEIDKEGKLWGYDLIRNQFYVSTDEDSDVEMAS
jgi:hypothetical protein